MVKRGIVSSTAWTANRSQVSVGKSNQDFKKRNPERLGWSRSWLTFLQAGITDVSLCGSDTCESDTLHRSRMQQESVSVLGRGWLVLTCFGQLLGLVLMSTCAYMGEFSVLTALKCAVTNSRVPLPQHTQNANI